MRRAASIWRGGRLFLIKRVGVGPSSRSNEIKKAMYDIPNVAMMAGTVQSVIFWLFVLALVLGLALGPRIIRSRERQKLYDVMRVAYERGQPVPPEVLELLTRRDTPPDEGAPNVRQSRDLRRAVVLIAVGLGIAGLGLGLGFGLHFASPLAGAIVGGILVGSGAIPGFIGLAYLLLWLVSRGGQRAGA